MEKHTPHCKLVVVKELVAAGKVDVTITALSNAANLGILPSMMFEIVANLTSADFYKSMTTHKDHRVWQDVYRPTVEPYGQLYIKLTVIDEVLIVSFKER